MYMTKLDALVLALSISAKCRQKAKHDQCIDLQRMNSNKLIMFALFDKVFIKL